MSSGRRRYSSPPGCVGERASVDKGKRKLSDLDVVGGKVSARGQLHVVMAEVRACLCPKNREAFRRTCFGHLLDLEEIKPQMQLIFLMLNSLDAESEGRNVLSFRVNNDNVELGREEFFCITGLSFKEGCPIPSSSKMHTRVFGGETNLKAKHILEALKNYDVKHGGTGSLVLKLALLYVVYGLLLNRDKMNKKIELEYMHLVDDLEAFNKYPWGKVAYEFFVYWTHRARMNVDRNTLESYRPSTDVCGIYITLQIFAYEVMPILASHCARRIDRVSFPRIRRWTTNSFFKYTVLLPYFHSHDVNSVIQFTFSENERGRLLGAGLSDADAIQRASLFPAKMSLKPTTSKLVDEDAVHNKGGVETAKMHDCDRGMSDLPFIDRGKSKCEDVVEEVTVTKAFPSSSSRRIRRENALRLGDMLKADRDTPSFRGSQTAKEMTSDKLGELMLEMKGNMVSQSESIKKLSDLITGMNSTLHILMSRQTELEKSVVSLRRSYEGQRSATPTPPMEAQLSEKPPTMDHINEAPEADAHLTHVNEEAFVKGGGLVNKELIAGDQGAPRVVVSVEGGVNCQVLAEEGGQFLAEEGGQKLKAGQYAVENLVVGPDDQIERGSATDCHDPVHQQIPADLSPSFELSDFSAYEPVQAAAEIQSGQPSARKRLFEGDDDGAEPVYRTITGEPLLKKRKTKGKGKPSKPVMMDSLLWEKFQPHREYVFEVERSFSQWFKRCRAQSDETPIQLPTQCKTEAPASWFKELYSSQGWLGDEHIDVLLNLLIIYSLKFPDDFNDDWTVIESMGTQTLMMESMHDVSERILPYVEGEYPHQGGKPWHEVSVVYGIGNIRDDHWILFGIHLEEQQVTFYDSLSAGKSQWEDIKVTFVNICLNVPRLVEMLDVYRNKSIKPTLKKAWDMVRYEHPPQQNNISDCGLLCMKSLECLVTGNSFSALDTFRCSQYRRGYCIELFAMSNAIPEAD